MKKLVRILSLFSLVSCADDDADRAVFEMQLQEQFEAIEQFAISGNCSEDTDCDYLPYGRKACGGPEGFVVFSTSINTEALQEMIEDYNELKVEYFERFDSFSDCSIVSPNFIAGCLDNKCAKMIE
ncbi:hypothetical protein [Zunongwangia endophytica]|uniref:Lipoprotein n=1 Tax=Zunongwangia endophytica TaxID=1808945 RepID=A0ABV8H6Q8_9FLAO|nr:hypothetical protein [Zunongwangia endophytica]MDN3595820.1 hypothetical protein [Zunongwangia endophytica]